MKKLMYLSGIVILSAIIFMAGCKKDEDPEVVGDPTIALVSGAGFISGDTQLPADAEFTVKISAAMNVNTEKKLVRLEVTRSFTPATKSGTTDTTYTFNIDNEEQVLIELTTNAYPQVGQEVFEYVIFDQVGHSDAISITITTEQNVTSWLDVDMGSYNDPTGSFLATSTGGVYVKVEAFDHQEIIDLIFYLGAVVNGSTFAGPADPTVQDIFNLNNDPAWTTFNDTRIISPAPIGYEAFNAIGDTYQFPGFEDSQSETFADKLEKDDVIYFKTADGKKGFLKLNSINGRGDYINIDVKVEKSGLLKTVPVLNARFLISN